MKYFFILLTVITCGICAKAQTAEDSVKAVINNMFTGMKNADAVLLKSSFADSMVLQTISRDKQGNLVVKNEDPAGFIDFVSKQKPGAADERISFETIKIDGPLALVWTPYNFYFNGQFSHCGVNSFQVIRFSNGWRIQYIIDTRRRQGCPGQ